MGRRRPSRVQLALDACLHELQGLLVKRISRKKEQGRDLLRIFGKVWEGFGRDLEAKYYP